MPLQPADIDALTLAPAKIRTEAGESDQRPAADVIALDNHSANVTAAAKNPWFGLRTKKINPGSAV